MCSCNVVVNRQLINILGEYLVFTSCISDSALKNTYTVIEQNGLECMKSAVEDSSDSTKLTAQLDLEIKLMAANKRIVQLEFEVSQYKRYNADLIRQLSILQSDYEEPFDQGQLQNRKFANNASKIERSCEDLSIYDSVDFLPAVPSRKPFMDKSTDVNSGK